MEKTKKEWLGCEIAMKGYKIEVMSEMREETQTKRRRQVLSGQMN